jgi:hypothetical protein
MRSPHASRENAGLDRRACVDQIDLSWAYLEIRLVVSEADEIGGRSLVEPANDAAGGICGVKPATLEQPHSVVREELGEDGSRFCCAHAPTTV